MDDGDELEIELSDDEAGVEDQLSGTRTGALDGELPHCGEHGSNDVDRCAGNGTGEEEAKGAIPPESGEVSAAAAPAKSMSQEEDSDSLDIELSESEPETGCGTTDLGSRTAPQKADAGPESEEASGPPVLLNVPCAGDRGITIPRKQTRVVQVVIDDDSAPLPASSAAASPGASEGASVGEKRILKRNEMDEISTHFKRGKKAAAVDGAGGVELRNLAKVKMHEMIAEEIQAIIEFPPPPRGLGPKRLIIHLKHPRVLELPFNADLSLWLHAQLDALLAAGSKLLWTDRCSGFLAFFANLSCLFTGREAGGVSVAKLGRFLTADRELNTKLLDLVSRLMLSPEVESHVAASREEGGESWGGWDESRNAERDSQHETMAGLLWHSLLLLHNYIEFETQFADEVKFQILTQQLIALPQLMALCRVSLDMLVARCLRGPWGNCIKELQAAESAKMGKAGKGGKGSKGIGVGADTPKISQSCKPRLFGKVIDMWLDLLVRSLQVQASVETTREARRMLVKHSALASLMKMMVQRLASGRCDEMAAKCIEMLEFLSFSRKFIRVLGTDKAFGDVRENFADLVLVRAVRLVSVAEEDNGALQLLKILNQLLFEDKMRECVLCSASVRDKLLDLVGQLVKGIDRMIESAKDRSSSENKDHEGRDKHKQPRSDADEGSPASSPAGGSRAGGGGSAVAGVSRPVGKVGKADAKKSELRKILRGRFLALFRLLARLARDDARPVAGAIYAKFGNTEQAREKLILSLMQVTDSGLLRLTADEDEEDRRDKQWFGKLVALLTAEGIEDLKAHMSRGAHAASTKELQQALMNLQNNQMEVASDAMSITNDITEVLSVVRDGKCVTIQGEEAERFKQLGDKHIKWVRRTGGGTEPAPFVLLRRNAYVHRKYTKLTVDSVQVCNCLRRPGKSACYDNSCLLRQELVECTPGFCPCGEDCKNQRFQRCQNAPTEVMYAGKKKGWGLFATADIEAGSFVVEYMGEVIDQKRYLKRKKEYAGERHTYFMLLNSNPQEMIDASRKSSMGRFLNHSCQPSCETCRYRSLGETVVGIFAIKDIKKGEELTIDYQMYDGAEGKECYCGAPNCRGMLGS
jgi:hypothetical protein